MDSWDTLAGFRNKDVTLDELVSISHVALRSPHSSPFLGVLESASEQLLMF